MQDKVVSVAVGTTAAVENSHALFPDSGEKSRMNLRDRMVWMNAGESDYPRNFMERQIERVTADHRGKANISSYGDKQLPQMISPL